MAPDRIRVFTGVLLLLTTLLPSHVACNGAKSISPQVTDKATSATPTLNTLLAPVPTATSSPPSLSTIENSNTRTIAATLTMIHSPMHTATPSTTPSATASPTTAPCSSSGEIVEGNLYSNIASEDIPYLIYLPPCYGMDGFTYPTLYMFHGGSYDETHWTDIGIVEATEQRIRSDQIAEMLIVLPGGGRLADTTSGGAYSYEEFVMSELIPNIETNFCASSKSNHRAIGGISRGGYWALEIAFRYPDSFASVGGHSAALLDIYAGPDFNPQITGLKDKLTDLRIYLDIGEEDWVIGNLRLLHEGMIEAGVEHTWVLNPGTHEDAYWADHLGEYLDWYTEVWSQDRQTYPDCTSSH